MILSFIFAGPFVVVHFSSFCLLIVLVFVCSIIAVFIFSDCVPFAIATFEIVPFACSFTFTVN